MPNADGEYSMGEVVRWLQRIENTIHELDERYEEARGSQMRWIMGILSAIVIFGVTGLLKAFLF